MKATVVIDATYHTTLFFFTNLVSTDTVYSAEVNCTAKVAAQVQVAAQLFVDNVQKGATARNSCSSSATSPNCGALSTSGGYFCGAGTACAGTYQTDGGIVVTLGNFYYWNDPLPSNCNYIGGFDSKTIQCGVQSNPVNVPAH